MHNAKLSAKNKKNKKYSIKAQTRTTEIELNNNKKRQTKNKAAAPFQVSHFLAASN